MEEDQSHDNWYSQVQLSQFFFLTPKTFKIIFEHKKKKSNLMKSGWFLVLNQNFDPIFFSKLIL